jgi:uncharacterized membrane protein
MRLCGRAVTREMSRFSIDPAKFFLVASLLVGLVYCVVVPYGAGFDEERHLARIYYMSLYKFMPNFPNATIHKDVFDLSYQRRLIQSPAFDMFERDTFSKKFGTQENDLRYGQKTQSIYSPVIFLPQALLGRVLWWKFNFPFLPTIILLRITGLLIYVAATFAAIRVIPFGKWILAALALFPAALYQAATLNADGFNNAISFLFIGWVLAVYVNERQGVRVQFIWVLVGLSVLLGLSKPGAIVLLLLLFILVRYPFPSRGSVLLLGAGILISVAVNIGWWMLASPGSSYSDEGTQSLLRQSGSIFTDPIGFISILVQSISLTFASQLQGWIAGFGYGAGVVPPPVNIFAAILLLSALLIDSKPDQLHPTAAIFLIGVSLFCSAAIYSMLFVANYATGGLTALAKHGRYYIPFAPLFFIGLSGFITYRGRLQAWMPYAALASFLLVTGYFSFGIYTAYYTYCGYGAYAGGTCTLPVYKNLEKEDAPNQAIHEGSSISQTFTNLCGDLETVQVFVHTVPADSTGALRFSLYNAETGLISSTDFPAGEIIPDDYLSLPVSAPPDTDGEDFEIRLESESLAAGGEFLVLLTPADYYPGQLTVGGEPLARDLMIHYVCDGP